MSSGLCGPLSLRGSNKAAFVPPTKGCGRRTCQKEAVAHGNSCRPGVCCVGHAQSVWALSLHLNSPSGFPKGSAVKILRASAGDPGDASSISGSGRSPGEGNGNPLQHSCLGAPRDRGAWRATVRGVSKSRPRRPPTLMLSVHSFTSRLYFLTLEKCPLGRLHQVFLGARDLPSSLRQEGSSFVSRERLVRDGI